MTAVYLIEIITKAYFPSKHIDKEELSHVKEAAPRLFVPMAVITAVMVSIVFWATPLFNFLETVAKGGF